MKELPKTFKKKINFTESCWLWTAFKNEKGYGQYQVSGKPIKAHRFAWENFNGEISEGLFVLHKCDVPACVNPDHLFLGTHQDNMDDMVRKGRQSHSTANAVTGEKNGRSKLTQIQVDEIRRTYKRGDNGIQSEFSLAGLARKFDVCDSTIARIVKNKLWVK